ncbi:MAG: hypothetical protein ACE15C_09925 [Phycisphaerae bacterium]
MAEVVLRLASPPLAFLAVLVACGVLYALLRPLRLRNPNAPGGLCKPYACGEEPKAEMHPDYGQFFPFAFFFTILHVVALMVTTVPGAQTTGIFMLAALFLAGAAIGLSILYRRY